MPFLVKFNALFSKKAKEEKCSQSKQVSTRTVSSPRVKYASLIALANAARGADAEQVFPRILLQAAHHKSVTSIRAPIGRGVPSGWFKRLVRQFAKSTNTKTILQIESPQDASITVPQSTSSVADADVTESTSTVNLPELSLSADCTVAAPATPLLGTIIANDDSKASICITNPAVIPVPTVANPTLQDFTLIKELGAGAFGTVFLARHNGSGVRVALKAIPKVPHSKDVSHWTPKKLEERAARHRSKLGRESEALQVSALDEVTALLRTQCMKSVLRILASFQDLGRYYIATEYIPGGDLATELAIFGALPLGRVRFYAADLLRGLRSLQINKIVHRDLKPANLLIAPDGHLVIADLGLARSFGVHNADIEQAAARFQFGRAPEQLANPQNTSRSVTKTGCGTAEYIAPEVWCGEEYSYPVDMWAFGVIMYELLLGKLPWDEYMPAYGHLERPELIYAIVMNEEAVVTDVDRVLFNIDAQAERLVLAALDKDQHRRPTPTQLAEHAFFSVFDWERHSSRDAPACWIPGARDDADELSPRDKDSFIEPYRALRPNEDAFPEFTFLSPLLSSGPPPSGSLPDLPAIESASSLDAVYSVPQTPRLPASPFPTPNSLMVLTVVNSHLGSRVWSALSTTVVGSPTTPSPLSSATMDSPTTSAPSPDGALAKVKKWVCKVWQRLKTRFFGT